ncbi:ATP synthase F1 subunit gamma [Burkholderia ubonensis]|uniref:ATP synthase F1 subunit gamma n=1 Tax=Burkholderia ubonensis TaxID=101571 RepID=UPI000756F71A|nr:ATP synthase F1 subunit gamma [Burkholderia ubonensis]KVC93978.1 ATP synthase F1 subunit gamma [Burkholderia ubonensis]KVQ69035.1 ATP synthase F1 subunit gamma [Burkholderia ubonensis]KVU40614.1 ATP synthase F1 subunit gamma [Burkholderia ubonensis]KVU66239.1 ATP synthase F1 subunit gamma [Burkholderia ubonensis]OJB40471.1 ATP synthase F1 subunit gamma [Burkholderia ubonensis]
MHIREIRSKIASTSSTRKITRAMEMMARTKMASAQKRARDFRPYAAKVKAMAERLIRDRPDYMSALMARRDPVRRIGLIVVSTDRGLCGPLNARLLVHCVDALEQWDQAGIEFELSVIGARGVAPLSRYGAHITARTGSLAGEPRFDALLGALLVPLTAFINGELDEVRVAYNRLTSALTYEPRIDTVLPVVGLDDAPHAGGMSSDYLYEPAPRPVADTVLLRYVEAVLYQAVVENYACEQCARMFSMQTATDNADRVLRDLRNLYQKTRQAQITTELCEIVAGAAAV